MMRNFLHIVFAFLFVNGLFGQEPELLKDFNTAGADAFGYEPFFRAINSDDFLYFLASTDEFGEELYRTNGTEIGTQLLKDIRPGSSGPNIVFWMTRGNTVYFSATDGENGYELWTSQGTTTSTRMVEDLNPGPGSGVSSGRHAIFKDALYFRGAADKGTELYYLDESDNSLKLVRDINPKITSSGIPFGSQIDDLTPGDNLLFFTANDGTHGTELWVSNGSSAGTGLVKDIVEGNPSTQFGKMMITNDILIFMADDGVNGMEPWISQGTEASTYMLKDITPGEEGSSVNLLGLAGNRFYFVVRESNVQRTLWKTNGLPTNTEMVLDSAGQKINVRNPYFIDEQLFFTHRGDLWTIDPETNQPAKFLSQSVYGELVKMQDTLYFVSTGGLNNGKGIWKSNGTDEGTELVKEVTSFSYRDVENLYSTGERLFFIAETEEFGRELWASDGTTDGTFMLLDSEPGPGDGFNSWEDVSFYGLGGELLFAGYDEHHGRELWKSDGSIEGTGLLKDINTQTQAGFLYSLPIAFNSESYFSTELGLWKTNGSSVGTQFVWEGEQVRGIQVLNSEMLFSAEREGIGQTIWKSDGSEAGTRMLFDSAAAVDLSLRFHGGTVRMGQNIYFSGWDPENNYELWKTDGSPEGTKMVKNINPEDASLYSIEEDRYIVFEDELYFVANDGSIGSELWKTDGTEEGTVPVTDINPLGSSSPRSLYEINGSILFIADDGTGGSELWKTDGSINGTSLLIDIYPGEEDGAFSYHSERYNGELYFAGNDGENGIELWKSDGTMEGTKMVKDISPSGSRPQDMMATDSLLYFTAADSLGRRIWQTDGTEAGTKPVLDMNGIDLMAVIDGILFFEAEDEEYGHELWRSNGTEEGTFMVKDIFEGPASSQPYFQSFVDGTLYFSAIDKDHGRELWALSQLSIGAKIQADVNEICGPETTVTISSSIENAGDNPVINWFLNDQPIEDENGSQLELSGLNDGDEVKMKVVADLSVWTDKKSIFSNTIRVRYSSLEPRITVAGNQLSTIEAAGYRWYFNGELLADETRSVTAESSGEYQVEVFNDSGCSFLSELVTVVACTNEEPVIQIDGDTISVDLSGSYTWYRDGEELPETGQSIITINPGFYRVEVTDIQGCVHTSNEVQIMLTGLENTHPGHVVNLYPNPASDFVIIESSLEEELEIHIIDLSGRKMHQGNLAPASSYELDLKTFPDGVYILIVETRKKSHLFRFIKH